MPEKKGPCYQSDGHSQKTQQLGSCPAVGDLSQVFRCRDGVLRLLRPAVQNKAEAGA